MLKNLLIAAALFIVSPSFVLAQDFFISFEENARVNTLDSFSNSTGSIFIFADEAIDFNQLDLQFNNSNSSVAAFTGGVVYNPGTPDSGTSSSVFGGAFTSFDLLDVAGADPWSSATEGRIFAISILSAGQIPGSGASNFRPGASGFLLARLDYDIVGFGYTEFSLILGDLGVFNDGVGQLDGLTFGAATLSTGIPVPLCLGFVPGDVDQDGLVTFSDIPPFIEILLAGGYQDEADCDFNGEVDFFDIPAFIFFLNAE